MNATTQTTSPASQTVDGRCATLAERARQYAIDLGVYGSDYPFGAYRLYVRNLANMIIALRSQEVTP